MSSLQVKDIISNLKKKGFSEDRSKDHVWLNFLTSDGKKTIIRTKVSHGKSEITEPLITKMAKQVHLNKKQFIELVSCSLSGDVYYSIVKEML